MLVRCQQQDIFKIRDRIPGHGLQRPTLRYQGPNSELVRLDCGCSIPVSWLTLIEQMYVRENVRRGNHVLPNINTALRRLSQLAESGEINMQVVPIKAQKASETDKGKP